MNNKEIATSVLKHPLIQGILKQKLAESSVVNRLIVEEIMLEDEIEEAKTPEQQTISNRVQNFINQKLSRGENPDLDAWNKAIETTESGENPGIYGWDEMQQDEKDYALLLFQNTKRYKASLVNLSTDPIERVKKVIVQALNKDSDLTWEVFSSSLKETFSESDWNKIATPAEEYFAEVSAPSDSEVTSAAEESAPAEIAGNIALAADLISLAALAVFPPAGVVTKMVGAIASIIEASLLYNKGQTQEAIAALIQIIPLGKLPFGKSIINKLLGALSKSTVAKEVLEQALKLSFKKFADKSPEEAQAALEGSSDGADDDADDDTSQQNIEMNPPKALEIFKNFLLTKNFNGETGKKYTPEEKLPDLAYKIIQAELEKGTSENKESLDSVMKWIKKSDTKFTEILNPAVKAWQEAKDDTDANPVDSPPKEPLTPEQVEETVAVAVEDASKDFEDVSEPEKQEFDKAIIENMDEFFGETEGKYSFMNRFFLSDQSQMLYNLVGNLNKILGGETGEEGGKEKALREENESEDHITIPWSKNSKVSLKRELGAFASLLRESKRITEAYNKYATQSSVDPRFDGSSLKRALTGEDGNSGIMGDVQWHTAKLADLLANVIADSKSEQPLDEALSGEERKVAIDTIRETYNKLGQLYINSLRPTLNGELDEEVTPTQVEPTQAETTPIKPEENTLSTVDSSAAEKVAREMLNLISKDPGIIKYFPRGIVNNQGKVVTLEAASKALDGQIKAFAKVLRDIHMTMKDESISPSDISRMYGVLKTLAQAIENSFGVDSLIKRKTDKILSKDLPESEKALDNGGSSDSEVSLDDEIAPEENGSSENPPASEPGIRRISDTSEFQKLKKPQQNIVNKFIKYYNQLIYPMEEGVTYKKETDNVLVSFAQKLNLGSRNLKEIFKLMGKKESALFVEIIMAQPKLRKVLEKYLGQQEDDEEVVSSAAVRSRDRLNRKIAEQKIIEKLTPIIEQFLKEK